MVGSLGKLDRLVLVGDRVLGERATQRRPEPDLCPRRELVALDDAPDAFASHHVRDVRRAAVMRAERDPDVDRVDRRGGDLYERLPGPALGNGGLADYGRRSDLFD